MARLLGLDIGTSGAKAVVVDEAGKVLASASRSYPLHTPQPGWAEQNPDDWWHAAQEILDELGAADMDAIGLTGQMHGSVFLDASGQVIGPALLWCDQRTERECEEIEFRVGAERLRSVTGNPCLTGFQLPKLLWLRRNQPEAYRQLRSLLLPKDFIRLRMTGTMVTDVSDASGVGALDLAARDWSDVVLMAAGVDAGLLPRVMESSQVSGSWRGVPVAAGAGDQAAAGVGAGAVEPGVVSVSLGTSGVVYEASASAPAWSDDAVHGFCDATGAWHRMAVLLSCGGAVAWAKEMLYPDATWSEFDRSASTAPSGSMGVRFSPHLAGSRAPRVDPFARAAWTGMSLASGRPELARSVLEGVCESLSDCLALMRSEPPREVRVTGGGAKSALWRSLLGASLGAPTVRLEAEEGPAFGAALLAGVSVGVWPDAAAAARACVRVQPDR